MAFNNMFDGFFLTEDQKEKIDLHDMQLDEARYYLEKFLNALSDNVKEITVVHGYRKGQVLLKMVRRDFFHPKIIKKVIPFNKGITIFYLK